MTDTKFLQFLSFVFYQNVHLRKNVKYPECENLKICKYRKIYKFRLFLSSECISIKNVQKFNMEITPDLDLFVVECTFM